MSLFANSIGAKLNLVFTDEPNDITSQTTFNGEVVFTDGVSGLDISDVSGNQEALDTLQNNIDVVQLNLDNEVLERLNGDNTLSNDLQLETLARTNADTDLQNQINLKLAEANSIHRENYAFYCVDGRNDLHSVLPNITNQGAYISISSGSFGNLTPLTIEKDNLSMFSVPSTPPICEFACPLTIASTANRIRTRYMSFDGVCNLNGKRCVYTHSTFNDNVNIGAGTTEYMTFANCEFSAGKTITFSATMASVVYIIECNIAGANLVFNNASPLQVIFSNCSGFVSLPTTAQATLIGLNVLASGAVVQHNISKIVLPTGEGLNNQVLTSTGSGNCIWTTPSGGGGGSSGVILEKFSNYTQGQVWNTSKGNTTLYNFTAVQSIANLNYHTTVLGSEISYAPPTGTTRVEYEFAFNVYNLKTGDNNIILQTQLLIDDVPQTITRKKNKLTTNTSNEGTDVVCKYTIDITGTTDPTKLTLANWNSAKSIKVQLLYDCAITTTFEIGKVFQYKNFPPDPAPIGTFSYTNPPILSITAY